MDRWDARGDPEDRCRMDENRLRDGRRMPQQTLYIFLNSLLPVLPVFLVLSISFSPFLFLIHSPAVGLGCKCSLFITFFTTEVKT